MHTVLSLSVTVLLVGASEIYAQVPAFSEATLCAISLWNLQWLLCPTCNSTLLQSQNPSIIGGQNLVFSSSYYEGEDEAEA